MPIPAFSGGVGLDWHLAHKSDVIGARAWDGVVMHGLSTLEPTVDAHIDYVDAVDRGTDGSVWTAGGCLSWYVDATGRNSTLWPGSVREYQRRLARFEIGDYATELPRPVPKHEPTLV